jgi:hypothetical protein
MALLSLDSFGPGTCYGPRYWVPFLPWLAIASVEGLRSIRRPWPILYALLLSYVPGVVLGAAIAVPGALRYWQLFERPASAAWHNLSGTHETRSAGLSGKAGSAPENQRKDTTTVMKDTRLAVRAAVPTARNYAPPESTENTVGGASVSSFVQAPLAKATTSLTLDSSKAKPDQLAIADVMSYSGAKPNIAAPAGWTLIRDDSSPSTRQSLYWHVIQANDPSPTWTFSEPVDAQGALLLLDKVAASNPVDASSGNTGRSPGVAAKSVTTTRGGAFIIAFYATDFGGAGLGPEFPANMRAIIDQENQSHEYWILGTYQSRKGDTGDVSCSNGQLYGAVAAQVAIAPGPTPTTKPHFTSLRLAGTIGSSTTAPTPSALRRSAKSARH